ncbi:MAG TPA: lipid A biosynthesis acyltransferase [Anaeromyxobacteraceae bacterium]|nr:lipid A biosynthesis acyltransferase [Anaeromyxobacteraceae bacterium]
MAVPLRKRIKRRVRSAVVRALLRLLAFLPLRPALWLGGALGALAHLLAARTRRLALAHLAIAFPERTEAERQALARGMFVHLGRSALELVASRSWDRRLESYVEMDPPGLLRELLARGRGMIFVTGHVGNWEILARRVPRSGVPCVTIARRSDDEAMNRLIERFRAEGGVTTLWREDESTGRAIIRTLRSGKILGLLVDQDIGQVQGVFVPFFGRLANTPRAAADLAIRFGAPVVVATIHRRGPRPVDGHRLEVVEIPYDPDPADRESEVVRLTAACTAALEAAIRRHPEEWVWMHERWKRRPPQEGGPAGAAPKSASVSGK